MHSCTSTSSTTVTHHQTARRASRAWNGFHSELRRKPAPSTCAYGGHEIWWTVTASDDREALEMLPRFISDRSLTIRITEVDIP